MSERTSEDGITLVEIMISLLVLGFVLTTFFIVITGSLRSLSESRARQAASQIATELIEGLRELAPSQIRMYEDPLVDDPLEFDPTTVSCGGVAGTFDPDGAGPLGCETIVTNSSGAILGSTPYQGVAAQSTTNGLTVATIATEVDDVGVPDGTVRVTVLLTYELPSGVHEIRRSAFFSEVARG